MAPDPHLHDSRLVDELREVQRRLDAMPEPVARVVASDAVPIGRAARMYDTRGCKLLYVNRAQVEAIPKKPKPFSLACIYDFGIPVESE